MQNIASFVSKGRIFQGKSGDVFSGPQAAGASRLLLPSVEEHEVKADEDEGHTEPLAHV